MTLDEAKGIMELWFANRKIDAIKRLRAHTPKGRFDNLGLREAKEYLDENSIGQGTITGQEALLMKLCTDFVEELNKTDLLNAAYEERIRINRRIAQLEAELYLEEHGEPRPAIEDDRPDIFDRRYT